MNEKLGQIKEKLTSIKVGQKDKIEELEKEIFEVFSLKEQLIKRVKYFQSTRIKMRVDKILGRKYTELKIRKDPFNSIFRLLQPFEEDKNKILFLQLLSLIQNLKMLKNITALREGYFSKIVQKLMDLFCDTRFNELFIDCKKTSQEDQNTSFEAKNKSNSENKPKKSFMIRNLLGLEKNSDSSSSGFSGKKPQIQTPSSDLNKNKKIKNWLLGK